MTEYAERDPEELDEGGHYCKHLMAMTAEDLHSKRDIACELAYRDKRIAELEARLLNDISTWNKMGKENHNLKQQMRTIRKTTLMQAAEISDNMDEPFIADAIRKEIDT